MGPSGAARPFHHYISYNVWGFAESQIIQIVCFIWRPTGSHYNCHRLLYSASLRPFPNRSHYIHRTLFTLSTAIAGFFIDGVFQRESHGIGEINSLALIHTRIEFIGAFNRADFSALTASSAVIIYHAGSNFNRYIIIPCFVLQYFLTSAWVIILTFGFVLIRL